MWAFSMESRPVPKGRFGAGGSAATVSAPLAALSLQAVVWMTRFLLTLRAPLGAPRRPPGQPTLVDVDFHVRTGHGSSRPQVDFAHRCLFFSLSSSFLEDGPSDFYRRCHCN